MVVVAVFAGQAIDYGVNGDWWAYEGFVEDIKREVRPIERVFMEDLSGRLALLSGRRFVAGDGLVNSNQYLHDYLSPGLVQQYLSANHIEYFLTSNIQCAPYRKRMPWTRDVGTGNSKAVRASHLFGQIYIVTVDISYLTRIPIKPSELYFWKDQLVFDKCVNGIRELLFRVN